MDRMESAGDSSPRRSNHRSCVSLTSRESLVLPRVGQNEAPELTNIRKTDGRNPAMVMLLVHRDGDSEEYKYKVL